MTFDIQLFVAQPVYSRKQNKAYSITEHLLLHNLTAYAVMMGIGMLSVYPKTRVYGGTG